ncbi:MAG: hypothetical protein EA348_11285, partial [Pseudomonadaceae bacterium]
RLMMIMTPAFSFTTPCLLSFLRMKQPYFVGDKTYPSRFVLRLDLHMKKLPCSVKVAFEIID